MKRPKYNSLRRRYPRRQAPQTNAGTLIARRFIVRALRKEGMQHVLKGRMATVGFIVPQSVATAWIHSAAIDLLNDLTSNRQTYHLLFDSKKGSNSKGHAQSVNATLVDSHILFGFASEKQHFSDAFLAAADRIVALESVDHTAIQTAFRAIMGVSAPTSVVEAAATIQDGMLSAIVKRGRRLPDVVQILGRQRSSVENAARIQTIDTLSGYGEAADWGRALVSDLAAYKAGSITWADVDGGALMSGPSGTGKTFFAQCLAATCGVPLYAHSLAQWQAKGHLGSLLAAMRAAFDQAIANAPCILFLDEFDAFGSRDRLSLNHEQYCSEVINALLECLDGVEKRTGVVVIGATNYPERIDHALLRPGRLGRHLQISLPDTAARLGILRHHLGDAIAAADLTRVAARLEGATGAVIEQIVRDARRRARTNHREMAPSDLTASLPARANLSEESFLRACTHEAGHALVGYVLRDEAGAVPVEIKVFREISETRMGHGHTIHRNTPGFDRTPKTYLAIITTILGGLAAEHVLMGEFGDFGGSAPGSDLHQATMIATAMVASFGMDGSLVYLTSNRHEDLSQRLKCDGRLRSRVEVMLRECFNQAEAILSREKATLRRIVETLQATCVMNADELAEHIARSS